MLKLIQITIEDKGECFFRRVLSLLTLSLLNTAKQTEPVESTVWDVHSFTDLKVRSTLYSKMNNTPV